MDPDYHGSKEVRKEEDDQLALTEKVYHPLKETPWVDEFVSLVNQVLHALYRLGLLVSLLVTSAGRAVGNSPVEKTTSTTFAAARSAGSFARRTVRVPLAGHFAAFGVVPAAVTARSAIATIVAASSLAHVTATLRGAAQATQEG